MPEVPAILDQHGRPLRRMVESRVRGRASLSGGDASGVFPYDAASHFSKETSSWFPGVYSPDYEINWNRDRVVGRSRDLDRNDGWAKGGKIRIADSVVGAHFHLTSMPDYQALAFIDKAFDHKWADEFSAAAEAKFRNYARDPNRYCDASETLLFEQMLWVAFCHKIVDGEDLIAMEWHPDRVGYGGARYATAFRLIDPDRLSNPRDQVDTKYLRGGVEIDDAGVPRAYHIRRAHLYDWYNSVDAMTWDRVERQTEWGRQIVIHDLDRERADQHRGVPLLASVMPRMKMLTRYDRAELQAAVNNAILSFAFKSPNDPEGLKAALDDGGDESALGWYWKARELYNKSNPINMEDARILQLFPGEDAVTLGQTRPGEHHDPYTNYILRNIAAGLGTTAEQLTQDWSKANYSSIRAALIEARKTVMRRRANFAANTATPIYCCWLEEAMDLGELPLPKNASDFVEARPEYSRCRWIGPAQGWVDPVKERQGVVLGMDAALSTLQDECAEQGGDWRQRIDQRSIEVERFKQRGLKPPVWAGQEDAHDTATKPLPE